MVYKMRLFVYNLCLMRRNIIVEFVFIVVLIIFSIFCHFQNFENIVLKVFSPNMFAVDFNGNRNIDTDEIVCVSGVKFFVQGLNDLDTESAKKFNVAHKDALSLFYLAKDFAEYSLLGKSVKFVADVEQRDFNCLSGDVFVDNKSFRESLLQGGYAYSEVHAFNLENFNRKIQQVKSLHPIIFNRKSKKYHEIDCKYGRVVEDYVVLMHDELPENALPCKLCHREKETFNLVSQKTFPDRINDGNIRMFLTDMTSNIKVNSDCSTNVCQEFLNAINAAQETIDIATYGWASVEAIDNALKDAVARGVKFRLVYDFSKKNYYPQTSEIARYALESRNDLQLGNPRGSEYLMHNKFMIFDGKKVATGSLNYSKTDFSGFNSNFVMFIEDERIAKIYTAEFEQMLGGKFHTDKVRFSDNLQYKINNSYIEVCFSPQDNVIINKVLGYVDNAQKYIYMPVFVITHKELEAALLRANARGVDVKLIVDATNVFAQKSIVQRLREKGISVKVENYAGKLHSKSMIIDDKYILAGSMNFSRSGETKNDENMLIIENPRFATFYRDYFNYLWGKIPEKYLTTAPRAESIDSIGSCFDGIDNDFDGRIDKADEGCLAK